MDTLTTSLLIASLVLRTSSIKGSASPKSQVLALSKNRRVAGDGGIFEFAQEDFLFRWVPQILNNVLQIPAPPCCCCGLVLLLSCLPWSSRNYGREMACSRSKADDVGRAYFWGHKDRVSP